MVVPDLPSWVAHPRTAWFIIEGVVLAAFGVALVLVGPTVEYPVGSLGRLAILVGLITASLGALVYGILQLREKRS